MPTWLALGFYFGFETSRSLVPYRIKAGLLVEAGGQPHIRTQTFNEMCKGMHGEEFLLEVEADRSGKAELWEVAAGHAVVQGERVAWLSAMLPDSSSLKNSDVPLVALPLKHHPLAWLGKKKKKNMRLILTLLENLGNPGYRHLITSSYNASRILGSCARLLNDDASAPRLAAEA